MDVHHVVKGRAPPEDVMDTTGSPVKKYQKALKALEAGVEPGHGHQQRQQQLQLQQQQQQEEAEEEEEAEAAGTVRHPQQIRQQSQWQLRRAPGRESASEAGRRQEVAQRRKSQTHTVAAGRGANAENEPCSTAGLHRADVRAPQPSAPSAAANVQDLAKQVEQSRAATRYKLQKPFKIPFNKRAADLSLRAQALSER